MVHERCAGPNAVLLDFTGYDEPLAAVGAATAALSAAAGDGRLPTVIDVVPAATTVLVQADGPVDALGIRRALRSPAPTATATEAAPVQIAVNYDGPDLAAVAATLGMSAQAVVAAHTGGDWQVAFVGFAPGFGYLVPADADNPLTRVPRRAESRPRVPGGSVAVAAGYSAVYPTTSPGGWHLLGRTDVELFNPGREHPALLSPGVRVRFHEAVGR